MKLLLDTHVWLWMLSEPNRLSTSSLNLVTDESNELYLSAVSGWENLNILTADRAFQPYDAELIGASGS